jgi:hypothetical protein
MAQLNSKLPQFMFAAAAQEFRWGKFDCGLWLADWFCVATMQDDPASGLRGRYWDEASCQALFGKVPAARMVREIARRAGLARTSDPFFGDVGVIEIPLPKQIICGAIRGRNAWTVLMPAGLQRIPDDMCRTVMAFKIEEKA